MKANMRFKSFVLVTFNDREFEVHVNATGNHYHEDEVRYFKDGSGQPAYDEFEIDDFEIERVYEPATEKDTTEFEGNADFEEAVSNALYDEWENGSDSWSYPDDEMEDRRIEAEITKWKEEEFYGTED